MISTWYDFLPGLRLPLTARCDTPSAGASHLPLEGGGRPLSPTSALAGSGDNGREGVTALSQILRLSRLPQRRGPTPDCLWQSDSPPAGEGRRRRLCSHTNKV